MRINKEGYKIIGISGAVCVFLWWLIYHLLVSDANISLLWVSAVLLLLFWFFIVAFFREPRRVRIHDADLAFSPCDGRVVVTEVVKENEYLNPITFEAMAADTDGYFSADHQKIAIRQGMSEVQTVSATVHEIAHSKLHDPKQYDMLPSWKVVLESEGGTKHDFKLDFATEKEAEQFASDMDWRYVDENQFEWRLAVEEDPTTEKQAIKNRHTEEVDRKSVV